MPKNSTGAIHDRAGITMSGNREERDAQVERIQERHERLHRVDATVGVVRLAESRSDVRLVRRRIQVDARAPSPESDRRMKDGDPFEAVMWPVRFGDRLLEQSARLLANVQATIRSHPQASRATGPK